MTAYLAQRITATPQLQRVLGASTSNLGQQVGTAGTANTNLGRYTNTACYFQGALYRLIGGGVYRSIDDGVTQTLVASLSVLTGGGTQWTGPYVVYDGAGIPRLAIAYLNGSGLPTVASSLNGVTWTTPLTPGGFGGIGGFPVVYRGTLAWYDASNTLVWQFNPSANTVASFAGVTNTESVYMVVWDDVLYAVGAGSGGGSPFRLTRLTGGTPVNVLTIYSHASTTTTCAAWVDPATNNLIVVVRVTSPAWKAFEITPGLVVTEVTGVTSVSNGMLTGISGAGTLFGFPAASKIVGVFYDQEANPGGAPVISLLAAASTTAGSSVSQFRYNGVSTLMGGVAGIPNDSGGDVDFSWPDKNVGGERFFTPRSVGVDGVAVITNTGKGALGIGVTRRKFKLQAPRSQLLTTIGGSPATYNLATTPLSNTPLQAGFVTIRGVVAAANVVAQDNGAGVFPVSTLLPAGGTINYALGTMTGTTASLDAGSQVEALYNGGTATNEWYRSLATNEYPGSTTKAPLTSPTSGSIVSDQNIGCVADGSEQQVSVGMSGFTAGDRVYIEPRALP